MSLHDALEAAKSWPELVENLRWSLNWHDPSWFIETLDRLQEQCREHSWIINESRELLTRIAPCKMKVNGSFHPHASAAALALAQGIQWKLWSVVDHDSYWSGRVERDQSKRFDTELIWKPEKWEACRKATSEFFAADWWKDDTCSDISTSIEIELQHYVTNVGGKGLEKVQSAEIDPPLPAETGTPGYLGLIVDEKSREIRRAGYDCSEKFPTQASVVWGLFLDAFKAKGSGSVKGYSRQNKFELNKRLEHIGVTISGDWQLVESPNCQSKVSKEV
jgi:hypothetical protein